MLFKDRLKQYDPNTTCVAVDFETYYGDDVSVSNMSYYNYSRHPQFEAYLVSIHCPDLDLNFVGDPKEFDWNKIKGLIWASHNSPFDRAVYESEVERGHLPDVEYHAWVNTIDLCSYLKVPRSLGAACKILFGKKLNKQARADMKNRHWCDLSPEEKKVMIDYADEDAIFCYKIWEEFKDQWPQVEQEISLQNSELVFRGVPVDLARLKKSLEHTSLAVQKAESNIPWAGEQAKTPTGKLSFFKTGEPKMVAIDSSIELAKYARTCGIPLPSTTSAKEEEFQEWAETYGERFPIVKDLQTWRRCNRALNNLQEIHKRLRPDGRMEIQLTYFGAHTGRWSGTRSVDDEKAFNMQNLLKDKIFIDESYKVCRREEAKFTVDIRAIFACPRMGLADLSQIEPRVMGWLTNDMDFLIECRISSPYEAHARSSMGWTGGKLKSENPVLYALAKARVLALGYQAGWKKFISMAAMYIDRTTFIDIFGADVSDQDEASFVRYVAKYAKPDHVVWPTLDRQTQNIWVNSWLQVCDFRANSKKISKLWGILQRDFKTACVRKEDYSVTLPSGRKMTYHKCRKQDEGAEIIRGTNKRKKMYGGLLTENLVQATARDIFARSLLDLEKEGFTVLWHVHDEVIVEFKSPDQNIDQVLAVLSREPDFMPGLPVAAEGEETTHYKK